MKISIDALKKIHRQESSAEKLRYVQQLGGVDELVNSLKSDAVGTKEFLRRGLQSKDVSARRDAYGVNRLPALPMKTFMEMFLESFEDETLRILIAAAFVSLGIGVYDHFTSGKNSYIEGVAILVAVVLVAIVTALNNFNKEKQFQKLNASSEDFEVKVIRDGSTQTISTFDLVAGDLLLLETGDKVAADGIVLKAEDLQCDESSLTGEAEPVLKETSGDIFLCSGTNITNGKCSVLVISVGENSWWGEQRAKLQVASPQDTPLQEKLGDLADQIGKIGTIAAGATFVAMILVWYFRPDIREKLLHEFNCNDAVCSKIYSKSLSLFTWKHFRTVFYNKYFFKYVLDAFIMAVTIVVVAVPEGLPLAVTLSLAYSTSKMMHENNLIRVLDAVETMGNATTLCSDKTGTLTKNEMTVTSAFANEKVFDMADYKNLENIPEFSDMLRLNIALNSTAHVSGDKVTGNSTEGALLKFLTSKFGVDYNSMRNDNDVKHFTYDSTRKCMSTFVHSKDLILCKGAPEVVLRMCTHVISGGSPVKFNENMQRHWKDKTDEFGRKGLRVLAFAHRLASSSSVDITDVSTIERDLVLDCFVCIQDPLRPETKSAVRQCQAAGIFVRMITGDNLETAKNIATECGILTEAKGGIAIEGRHLREMSPDELDKMLPKIQVVARATPDDKYILVTRLNGNLRPKEECEFPDQLPGYKEEWDEKRESNDFGLEVVGVTGDGTNDAQALRAADVGLAMNSGTVVAKEAADITILDNDFASCVRAVVWGRVTFDNIRRFLQFQLTVNAVALTLTFIAAITGNDPPLNAVMMLWVNLIMDTFGALALGTESPNDKKLLNRLPYKRDASLISSVMTRNIIVQSIFQLAVLLFLQSERGNQAFGIGYGENSVILTNTVIFNVFVFCQVFNEFNSRAIDDTDYNILLGLHKNIPFIFIIVVTVLAQFCWISFGGDFIKTTLLTQDQWIKSVAIASLSLPVGYLMRFLPKNIVPFGLMGNDEDTINLTPLAQALKARADDELKALRLKNSNKKAISKQLANLVYLSVVLICPVLAASAMFPSEVAAVQAFIRDFLQKY